MRVKVLKSVVVTTLLPINLYLNYPNARKKIVPLKSRREIIVPKTRSKIHDPTVKKFFEFLLRSKKKYFRIDQAVKDYQEKTKNFDPKLHRRIAGHFQQLTTSGYTNKIKRSLYANDFKFKNNLRKYLDGELEIKYPGHLRDVDKLLEKARLELFNDSHCATMYFLEQDSSPDPEFRKLVSEVLNC